MSLVFAHAIEKEPEKLSSDGYNISSLTDPKFPVVDRTTHLDFLIEGRLSNAEIELHKNTKTIKLGLKQETPGHFSTGYVFGEAGTYEVHVEIDGKELEGEFLLEVTELGFWGLLQIIIMILFVGGFSYLAYRNCKSQ